MVFLDWRAFPAHLSQWKVKPRGALRRAATVVEQRDEAVLYRKLVMVVDTVPIEGPLEDLASACAARTLHELMRPARRPLGSRRPQTAAVDPGCEACAAHIQLPTCRRSDPLSLRLQPASCRRPAQREPARLWPARCRPSGSR